MAFCWRGYGSLKYNFSDLGGNDGTDWWRANMNGQQLPAKPRPNTTWNHTPKNNTDFKQWGVEDHEESNTRDHNAPNSYGAIGGNRPQRGGIQINPSGNSTSTCDSMWVSGLNPGLNQSQKHNEWSGVTVNSCGPWGDTQHGNNR